MTNDIAGAALLYRAARRWPLRMGRWLLQRVAAGVGSAADLRDFTPRYHPWEQRLCIVADGDLFRCVRDGRAQVVTDEIDSFDTGGIRLRSGRRLDADTVVTPTGLRLQAMGGIDLRVDGRRWHAGKYMLYRGVLPEGLPNAAWILGYINSSWTLKAELSATYVCRLIAHMDAQRLAVAVAHDHLGCRTAEHVMSALDAGYIRRGASELPRQGDRAPWRVTHDLRIDRWQLLHEPIDGKWLRFEPASSRDRAVKVAAAATPARGRTARRRSRRGTRSRSTADRTALGRRRRS